MEMGYAKVPRPEMTGKRSLEFSRWVKLNLPAPDCGYMVGNLDWMLWNYKTKELWLLEEKTRNGTVSEWLTRFMRGVMVPALREFCANNGIEFKGFHVITFEHTNPADGRTWLDGIEIDAQALKTYLSGLSPMRATAALATGAVTR